MRSKRPAFDAGRTTSADDQFPGEEIERGVLVGRKVAGELMQNQTGGDARGVERAAGGAATPLGLVGREQCRRIMRPPGGIGSAAETASKRLFVGRTRTSRLSRMGVNPDPGYVVLDIIRLWLHTHPGESAEPSSTDEETFECHRAPKTDHERAVQNRPF